jgi:hypothetical protein
MSIYQEQADLFCANLNLRTFTDLGIEFEPFELPDDATEGMSGELNPFYGLTHTTDSRAKISKAATGRVNSEEYKQAMSETLKKHHTENPRPQEWRDKLSNALKGKKKSEEHCNNISKTLSDGRMAGKNNGRFGKEVSQETRDKITKANKGRFAGENNPMYGKSATKGMKWYNNGTDAGRYFEGQQPNGFVLGRIEKGIYV